MLAIKNGRVIDPFSGRDELTDIYIDGGKIAAIGGPARDFDEMIPAKGLVVSPGLVDMHVHFRDPGFTYKEDILSGGMAAAAGGFTSVLCMPNTSPVVDSAETVEYVLSKGRQSPVNILTCAAVTIGQKGGSLTDFAGLSAAGASALSDDGMPVDSALVMRQALIEAKKAGMLIISHCEDGGLVEGTAVNEGRLSRLLSLPGRPAIAEELVVARDAMLAADTGGKVHIAHVSTGKSVDIIRKAKAAGVSITAETCPQYFCLTEDEVLKSGTMAKVNPPLRTEADRLAIIEGLADGTLDAIVTDHAPHSAEEKSLPILKAPSGMAGLETSLALSLKALYHGGILSLPQLISKMSMKPSEILGLNSGRIVVGGAADIVIFDPDEKWTVQPSDFRSKARNTPFAGMEVRGRVKYTIVNGSVVYEDRS